MTPALFALALITTPPSELPRGFTAGQLADGCARLLVARSPASPDRGPEEAVCDAIATLDLAAAEFLRQAPEGQPLEETELYCLPDAVVQAGDAAALQRAFVAYVDAHPAVRSEDGVQTFERALAEEWPCPR